MNFLTFFLFKLLGRSRLEWEMVHLQSPTAIYHWSSSRDLRMNRAIGEFLVALAHGYCWRMVEISEEDDEQSEPPKFCGFM